MPGGPRRCDPEMIHLKDYFINPEMLADLRRRAQVMAVGFDQLQTLGGKTRVRLWEWAGEITRAEFIAVADRLVWAAGEALEQRQAEEAAADAAAAEFRDGVW